MSSVHLVGSVSLPDTESVFRTACTEIGDALARVPDGEVQRPYGSWMMPTILAHPAIYAAEGGAFPGLIPQLRIEAGYDGPIEIGDFGIADAARESYALFSALKREGAIPAGARFQIGTPSAVTLAGLAELTAQERLCDALIVTLGRELAAVVDMIPHDELAIQIELPGDVGTLEGVFPAWFGTELGPIVEYANRLVSDIPADVQVGFHLCYGDPPPSEGERGQHWADPADLGLLVKLANALIARIERPVNFIHMPVPIERDDEPFFHPLTDLDLPAETELFLGLIHDQDGLEGSKRRIAAARTARRDFGVATECGMGRLPGDIIPGLMRLHAETARLLVEEPTATR